MENSNLFKLNWLDLLKAIAMFFISAIVSFFYDRLTTGVFPTWIEILANLKVALYATFVYVIKQLISGNTGIPLVRGDLEAK